MAPTHPNPMPDLQVQDRSGLEALAGYPLFEAMRGRRSRRFGRGMRLEHGPLAYASSQAPLSLSEVEEALLSYAACGITGHVLADLEYARGRWLTSSLAPRALSAKAQRAAPGWIRR
jgi:hypothetical protein